LLSYPTRTLVKDLVYKRGFAKVNGQRLAIHDNAIIEANLGKFGITGIEELIHELVTVGPNFKQANTFLWYLLIDAFQAIQAPSSQRWFQTQETLLPEQG
jgi:60S ribosomal protein uL30